MAPAADEPPPKTITQLIAEGRAPLDLSDEDAVYVFDALLAGLCRFAPIRLGRLSFTTTRRRHGHLAIFSTATKHNNAGL